MAIDGSSLLAPLGPVTLQLFAALDPAQAAEATAEIYAEAGTTRATAAGLPVGPKTDEAAVAWAVAQALANRAQQILSAASSLSADGAGSRSYSTAQATELQQQAEAWERRFYLLEEQILGAGSAVLPLPPAPSVAAPTRFSW